MPNFEKLTESKMFSTFLLPERRKRFDTMLQPKKRQDFLNTKIPHFQWLNSKKTYEIPRDEQCFSSLMGILKDNGAGDKCYVISEIKTLDKKVLDLEEAILSLVEHGHSVGSLICCIPGKLGLYYGEDRYHVLLLKGS